MRAARELEVGERVEVVEVEGKLVEIAEESC
jgi:membrane protein implicated in regulation of membrane protease activity